MANEVAVKSEKEMTLSEYIGSELTRVENALPKDLNKARFAQNAVALLQEKPELMDYGKDKVVAGLLKGATLGLDFYNRECYLVPFGKQLNFMTDYKGAKKLAKKYSVRPVKDIYAKLIREGDEFVEKIENGEPTIDFRPKFLNDGKIIGAFAVALYQDGGISYEVMSLAELEKIRSCSKQKSGAIWANHTGEMYKKTVLHRICKNIELDPSINTMDMFAGNEIETDTETIVENDIQNHANSKDFDIEIDDKAPFEE